MTFPVPLDAVAHGLRVELDGRALVGVAEAKVRARAAYEAAIDAGKTAILHEEALKGVHVLAIGHIPAGKEVAVEIAWSKPLTFAGAMPTLRLPTTVAEIYGRLPLLPADDLVVHDKLVFEADLSVNVSDGVARLRGDVLGSAAPALSLPPWMRAAIWSTICICRVTLLDVSRWMVICMWVRPVRENPCKAPAAIRMTAPLLRSALDARPPLQVKIPAW